MIVKRLPDMTLAFLLASGTDARPIARQQMDQYLMGLGLDPAATKTYFYTFAVSQRGIRAVNLLLYGVVPAGSASSGRVTVINLPSGEYLTLTISKHEYDDELNESDRKIADAAKEWLHDHDKKFDIRYVMGLIESDYVDGYDMYNIYLPIR